MEGKDTLLIYDSDSRLAFYDTDGRWISPLNVHQNWTSPNNNAWSHILPGKFSDNFKDLVCYDALWHEGEGEDDEPPPAAATGDETLQFYKTEGLGEKPKPLGTPYQNWNSVQGMRWTKIRPGKFSDSPYTDLLFYDGAGAGQFYTTDGHGGKPKPLATHTGWVSPGGLPWRDILPGKFIDSGTHFADLLFYDKAGNLSFFTTDGHGAMTLLSTFVWKSPDNNVWTRIRTGKFVSGSHYTDLLGYDENAGTWSVFTVDGTGAMPDMQTTGMFDPAFGSNRWTRIVPSHANAPYGENPDAHFVDPLFVDEAGTGTLSFYASQSDEQGLHPGSIWPLATHIGLQWSGTWRMIIGSMREPAKKF